MKRERRLQNQWKEDDTLGETQYYIIREEFRDGNAFFDVPCRSEIARDVFA